MQLFSFLSKLIRMIFYPIIYILRPFKIIKKIPYEFGFYTILILVFSHIGLIFGLLYSEKNSGVQIYIIEVFKNGILFNMAISLLSASIFPIVILLYNKGNEHFKGLRLLSLILSIILLVLNAGLFSMYLGVNEDTYMIVQGVLYFISVVFVIYLYLIQHLEKDYGSYSDMDDRIRDNLIIQTEQINNDGYGVEL